MGSVREQESLDATPESGSSLALTRFSVENLVKALDGVHLNELN